MQRTLRQVIAGAAGGAFAWLLYTAISVYAVPSANKLPGEAFFSFAPGALFAVCVVALLTWSVSVPIVSPRCALRQGGLGILVGLVVGGSAVLGLMQILPTAGERVTAIQTLIMPWVWYLGLSISISVAVAFSALPTKIRIFRAVVAGILGGILSLLLVKVSGWPALNFLSESTVNSIQISGLMGLYHFSSLGLNVLIGASLGLGFSLSEMILAVGRVRLILNQASGIDFLLSRGVNRIGSAEGMEIPIFDVRVAELHAEIFRQGDQLRIRDKGSALGTWVNGVQISETAIRPGDSIQIGPYPLIVTDASGALSFSSYTYTVTPSGPTAGADPSANPWPYRRFPVVEPPPPGPRDAHRLIGPFGLVHELETGAWDIGRNRTASIQLLHDGSVSRRHAMVQVTGAKAILTDLGSRNGTFVNGELVDGERELQPGDMVRLGVTRMAYRV